VNRARTRHRHAERVRAGTICHCAGGNRRAAHLVGRVAQRSATSRDREVPLTTRLPGGGADMIVLLVLVVLIWWGLTRNHRRQIRSISANGVPDRDVERLVADLRALGEPVEEPLAGETHVLDRESLDPTSDGGMSLRWATVRHRHACPAQRDLVGVPGSHRRSTRPPRLMRVSRDGWAAHLSLIGQSGGPRLGGQSKAGILGLLLRRLLRCWSL